MLDLVRGWKATARAQRPAVQGRDRVGVGQHVLEVLVWRLQAASREGAAKHVAGAGAVDAVHLKGWGADLAAVAPGEGAFGTQRHRHDRRAELAADRGERAPELFVAGERGRKLLRSDDHVDVLEQIGDGGP